MSDSLAFLNALPPGTTPADERGYLRHLVEEAPMAILVLRGPEWRVELANAATAAAWGRAVAPLLGRPFFEALPAAAGQGLEALFEAVARTGEPATRTEMLLRLAAAVPGGPLAATYYNFTCQRLHGPAHQPAGLLLLGAEVSAQVADRQRLLALAQELRASNAQLTRTNADLDNFIYTASHDLKLPIDNIEGLLQGLREELPPFVQAFDHVQAMLGMMQESVDRFQLTIAQLTDLAHLQAAHDQPPERLDPAAVVEAVRRDLEPLLAAANARLTVAVEPGTTAAFSARNLRSVVYNLLSNAVKYRHPARPPLVQLRCHRTAPATTVLEVQDNGLGLSEAQQGQVFDIFCRLHPQVPGAGLGLYMVRKIVENAGGTLTVQSQPGVGSTFTASFPG